MRKTIIFETGNYYLDKINWYFDKDKNMTLSIWEDKAKKILRLQKKIDDLKNRGTRKQNPTRKRLWILEWYNNLIQWYEKEIKLLGWEIDNDHDWELESIIKLQLLKNIPWYFPTPKHLVDRMIELAQIKDWDRILEPSAWTWNIIDWIIQSWKSINIWANEINYSNYEILKRKYKDNPKMLLTQHDFIIFNEDRKFDKIIMNPIFENKQDQEHIMKAYRMLKTWWRLVAICSAWVNFRQDYAPLRSVIDNYGSLFSIEEWAFKESWTGVNSVMIVLHKGD